MDNIKAPKTRAKKRLFSLPGEYRKVIIQNNYVTQAQTDFTMLQQRLFTFIIYRLQEHILTLKNKPAETVNTLDLFQDNGIEKPYIDIDIPLHIIGRPSEYNHIRKTAVDMMSKKMKIVAKSITGEYERFKPLFMHVDVYDTDGTTRKQKYSSILPIRIDTEVAKMIVHVDWKDGRPANYTAFLFDVAMCCNNKYTPIVYKFLSQWKTSRGGVKTTSKSIDIQQFRDMLNLEDKYKGYDDLKRRILIPVQREIAAKGDFQFEISETRVGKAVTKINFIYKYRADDTYEDNLHYVKQATAKARNMALMNEDQVAVVEKICEKYPAKLVSEKITYALDVAIKKQRHPNTYPNYVMTSLLTEFPINSDRWDERIKR